MRLLTPPPAPIALPVFLAQTITTPAYVVEPYVPSGGVVFLYGKSSIGKSPLTWEMARCVAAGAPFLGCRTHAGPVLYLDVDGTPPAELQKRLKLMPLPHPTNFHLCLMQPFNILEKGPGGDRLRAHLSATRDATQPILVIVNTLRKVHWADDKESDVPSRVYGEFIHLFQGAAVVFNHHDKKSSVLPGGAVEDPDETFSGSQAWLNDCTVALHLRKNGPESGYLRLDHTKSQVSEKRPPLMLYLDEDGTRIQPLTDAHGAKLAAIWPTLRQDVTKEQRVSEAAVILQCSPRTVWRWLKTEAGKHCH